MAGTVQWKVVGAISGMTASLLYCAAAFLPLPDALGYAAACYLGPLLAVGFLGLSPAAALGAHLQTNDAYPRLPGPRIGLLSFCLAVCGSGIEQTAVAAPQATVDRFGELEVVTIVQSTRNADTGRRGETRHWTLRWRGSPLRLETWGGMWLEQPLQVDTANAVFVVGDSATPDLLVLLGDPNNGSSFHRLHQQDGVLTTDAICKTSGGANSVRVLDPMNTARVFDGPQFERLPTATHLLLGQQCVYVVAEGRAHALPQPFDGWSIPYGMGAVALAPDAASLVRLLSSDEGALDLWVNPFPTGHSYALRIDPARMRFATWQDIDEAWLLHHFEWTKDAAGKDRLQERERFSPLPPRGHYLSGTAQYDLPQIQRDGSREMIAFLAAQSGAERLPDQRFEYSQEVSYRFRIDDEIVVVMPNGFFVEPISTGYWPGKPGDPERQRALVRRLGSAFDAALAEGKFAQLFVPEADQKDANLGE